MFLHSILRWNRLMCKQSKQSGCDEIREICLGSNRRSALRFNKVLSAGNLISSDVANALCQKRLRRMLALPRHRQKKKKKKKEKLGILSRTRYSSPHPPAGHAYTAASQSGGSDLHAAPTIRWSRVLSGFGRRTAVIFSPPAGSAQLHNHAASFLKQSPRGVRVCYLSHYTALSQMSSISAEAQSGAITVIRRKFMQELLDGAPLTRGSGWKIGRISAQQESPLVSPSSARQDVNLRSSTHGCWVLKVIRLIKRFRMWTKIWLWETWGC